MKHNKTTWLTLFIAAFLSIVIWYQFSYPQLEIMDFTVDKKQALTIAEQYLQKNDVDYQSYKTTTIFDLREKANIFLQRTLGIAQLKNFIKKHNFNLFQWKIRFFKEGAFEEYRIHVSSSTGEIIRVDHIIDPSAKRDTVSKKQAHALSLAFLKNNFNANEDDYYLLESIELKQDFRTDYDITWAKKGIKIPWNDSVEDGTGKILNKTTVSGNSILTFWKNAFRIPSQFNRYLENLDNTGRILGSISLLCYFLLLAASMYYLILGHQHISVHITKNFYLTLAAIAFILSCLSNVNQIQSIIYSYKTSSALAPNLWRYFIDTSIRTTLISLTLILPFLSGEYLHSRSANVKKHYLSCLYYIRTSFFTRNVAQQIWIGYLLCIIMLGIQSIMIKFGQNHLNVWVTHIWVENLASTNFPFITAIAMSLYASLSEEGLYRFFALKWGEKFLKNAWIPILISSLIWGFSHSGYPVYPKWFRGVELTVIGIFLCGAYKNFGLIPVIIAHFLFDIFWNCAGFLFGQSTTTLFYGSLGLLLSPFFFSCFTFICNKKPLLKPLKDYFSKYQRYNCQILKLAFNRKKEQNPQLSVDAFEHELREHNWDPAVIDAVLKDDEQKEDPLA